MAPFDSVTIITSPYHTGLRDHRVGDGPNRIISRGIVKTIEALGLRVETTEILPVDNFEGEIGRSFEILSRTSRAVSQAITNSSFPLVLSGNCMATVGVACGLGLDDLNYIYFDAHTDLHTPSTLLHGYFDALGLPILGGDSFHAIAKTMPGFKQISYRDRFLFCGVREVEDVERERIRKYGMDAIWGSSERHVDFATELRQYLSQKRLSPALAHLDLDVLDEKVGKVNGYESAGGMSPEQLTGCLGLVPQKVDAKSLVVCSFDPNLGDGDKIADIGIDAVKNFLVSMIGTGQLKRA